MQRPIAIDLFSGAGGLSLGFEQAGFDIAAAVEYDPIHAAIHELNFPETTTICADVRDLTGDDIRQRANIGDRDIDAVIGGPPCQGFSLIGHRVLEDSRNELIFHFARIVDELRPRTFVMENVPGMVSGKQTQLVTELIERFQTMGYQVRLPYQVLSAAHYGVPQDRRRLFLIGAREDTRLPAYPLPLSDPGLRGRGKDWKGDPGLTSTPTVGDALLDLPELERFEESFDSDVLHVQLSGGSLYAQRLRSDADDPADYSYPRQVSRDLLTGCLRARHTDLSRQRFAATTPGTTEVVSRFYRLAQDGRSNTLRAGTASDRGAFSAPRPIHPIKARCISVREAARLHSFPDWFRFHRTIWHGFRQIGNAVPPLLGRAVGSAIVDALSAERIRPTIALDLGDAELAALDMRGAAERYGVSRHVIPPRNRPALVGVK